MGELATNRGGDLCNLLGGPKPVQTRHQRVLERRRNCQWRKWPVRRMRAIRIDQKARLQDRFGKFLNEKGHPLGPGDYLIQHVRREPARARDIVDEGDTSVSIK